MPKYKKRDPEYTAIQFTGSNIREVMDELGPEFNTHYNQDIKGATDFFLEGLGVRQHVRSGNWIVLNHQEKTWDQVVPEDFPRCFEPIKRVGRPPKEKK